jgi:hypothetical protein
MANKLLDELKPRFDILFDGWDCKVCYKRNKRKIPMQLDYYIDSKEFSTPIKIMINENNAFVYLSIRDYADRILYSGSLLSNNSISEIIQKNVPDLDLMLIKRSCERLEDQLHGINSNAKLSQEQKDDVRKQIEEDLKGLKSILQLAEDNSQTNTNKKQFKKRSRKNNKKG